MKSFIFSVFYLVFLLLIYSCSSENPLDPNNNDPGNSDDGDSPSNGDAIILTGSIQTDSVLTDVFDDPSKADYRFKDTLDVWANFTVEPGVVIDTENMLLTVEGALNIDTGVEILGKGSIVDIVGNMKIGMGSEMNIASCSINDKGSLNLESGVKIALDDGGVISVSGTLIAEGTQSDPVVFTSLDQSDYWSGFIVAPSSNVNLNYVDVSYTGTESGPDNIKSAMRIGGGSISINNSHIHDNNGYGIYLDAAKKILTSFSNNTFRKNSLAGVSLFAVNVSAIENSNQFVNNRLAAVEIRGSGEDESSDMKKGAEAWPALNGSAYLVTREVDVSHQLTLSPGSYFNMGKGAGWEIFPEGSLFAEGTTDSVIVFQPALEGEAWNGIVYQRGSQQNSLKHVNISGAYRNTFHGSTKAAVVNYSELKVIQGEIHDNSEAGIYSEADGLIVENTSFYNNKTGIFMEDFDYADGFEPSFGLTIENNYIHKNSIGISLIANLVNSLGGGNRISDNDLAAIEIKGSQLDEGVNTTWNSLPNSSYFVSGDLAIEGELTINPGARFKMAPDVMWDIGYDGALIALGTVSNQITFTSVEEASNWKGLNIKSDDQRNALNYVNLSYGGSTPMRLNYSDLNIKTILGVYSNGNLSVTNTTISNSSGYGLFVENLGRISDFKNNTFELNTRAVALPANQVEKVDPETIFVNNSEVEVEITASVLDKEATWSDLPSDATYRVSGRLQLDYPLTISPGAKFEIDQDVPIIANGSLTANGGLGSEIVFTSSKPNEHHWKGILIEPYINADFDYVEISYGGNSQHDFSGNGYSANIGVKGGGSLTIRNSIISNSAGYGIYSEGTVNDNGGNTLTSNSSGNTY